MNPPSISADGTWVGLRILIADSYRDAADSLELLLRLWKQQTAVAYSGPEALERARTFRPHLVIAEIVLTGLNGYQLAEHLRREIPDAALIALTGLGRDEDRFRSREAGFLWHLVKPVEPAVLREVLVVAGRLAMQRVL